MRTHLPAIASLAMLSMLGLTACTSEETEPEIPRVTQPTDQPSDPTPSEPTQSGTSESSPSGAAEPKITGTIASGLAVPWGIDFLPSGDAVVTERDSRRILRVTPDGDITELGIVETAAPQGEAGLLGIAVSPDFEQDQRIFLYVTTTEDNRVLSTTLRGDRLGDYGVVLDSIPQGFTHDGGRLAFGPDGSLYVTTGETGTPDLSQDLDSLGGKILRITPDGEPAPDNPDPDSAILTSGHRNVQGLAWDEKGRLWASEFGAQTHDELNRIVPGENYGWPRVEGVGEDPDFVDPDVIWPVEDASPSGLAHQDGFLYMAALRGERLWRIDVRGGEATGATAFLEGEYGRLRTVVAAPDGSLWVATSNQDGRGNPGPRDDRILRLTVG